MSALPTKRLNCKWLLPLLALCSCREASVEDIPRYEATEMVGLDVIVRSSSESDASDIAFWTYACDSDGNVVDDVPLSYSYVSDESVASMNIPLESRYVLVVAVAGLSEPMLVEAIPFSDLSSTLLTGETDEDVLSHWAVADLMPDGNAVTCAEIELELFRTVSKVTLSVLNASDAMWLLVTDVSICSASAPVEGVLLSCMTPDQIKKGGRDVSQWWFNGSDVTSDVLSVSLVNGLEIEESGVYAPAGDCLLYENPSGWTNVSSYEAAEFGLCPADNEPECHGCYLSIEYRYAILPGVVLSEDSEDVTIVRKYIPLPPLCRGNEYDIKISVNLSDIIVFGNTEISEETDGVW